MASGDEEYESPSPYDDVVYDPETDTYYGVIFPKERKQSEKPIQPPRLTAPSEGSLEQAADGERRIPSMHHPEHEVHQAE